jgi:hypothetical protein
VEDGAQTKSAQKDCLLCGDAEAHRITAQQKSLHPVSGSLRHLLIDFAGIY